MTLGVAGWLFAHGEASLTTFVMVGFAGFARTGELTGAVWNHFNFDLANGRMTLSLPWTKGGRRRLA